MRQGRQNYQHKKRTMIRFYFGRPCATYHPQCAQCAAWRLSPTQRWAEAKVGVAEWIEAATELGAACRASLNPS